MHKVNNVSKKLDKNGGYLHPSVVITDYSPHQARKDIQSFRASQR